LTEPVFVDTSALYAVLDADDANHKTAGAAMTLLLDDIEAGSVAVTHGSVVVEASALVQRRLGMGAVRALLDDLLPLMTIVWVDADLHQRAVAALLAANRSGVSLVDWTSFAVMREQAIEVAFAYDDEFADQGFRLLRS
jgi:predicted nucleic acid-binding protein